MSIEISVIIPVYNQEKYLKKSLESIVNQTIGIENINVIIVNDKSTDNSLAILEEYASKYPTIKIINHKVNKGAGAAKNTGMEYVNSDYLTFLDSDDYLEEDFIEKALNSIKSNNCDLLIANWRIFPEDENSIHKPQITQDKVINSISEKPLLVFSTSACGKIYHKNLYEYLKFSNTTYDDNLVAIESLLNSKRTFLSKNIGNNYRKNPESVTKKINIKNPLDLSFSIKELFNLTNKYPNESKYINLLILKFVDDILFWLYDYDWFYQEELKIVKTLQKDFKSINQENIEFLNSLSSFRLLYPNDILNLNNYDAVTFLAKYKYFLRMPKINPIASLYIDTGKGFNEDEKVSIGYNLSKVNDLTFDLSNYENIKLLRFDPIEGDYISCKITETTPITNRLSANSFNSLIDEHQKFLTFDPRYALEGDFKDIKNINIKFELNILNKEDLCEMILNKDSVNNNQEKNKGFLNKLWG